MPLLPDNLEVIDSLITSLETHLDIKDIENVKHSLKTTDEILERLDESKVRLARTDRNAFCEYVLKDKNTKKNIVQGDIHRIIQYALGNYKKVFIEVSRGSGKTTQALASILFELGNDPDILIKIISASDDLATKRVSSIKTHIENNKEYHKVFPDVKPFVNSYNIKDGWGKTRLTLDRTSISPNASLEGKGVLATGVGDRADLLIFDDPCNLRNSIMFPTLRGHVIQSYENVWKPLLPPGGRQWYLATPWHEDDLTAVLKEEWKNDPNACVLELHVGQKITCTSDGKIINIEETDDKFLPIWPEVWDRKALKEQFGSGLESERSYERAYMCRAVASADIVFDPDWLEASKNNSEMFFDENDSK